MNIHSIAYNYFFIPIAQIVKYLWSFSNPKLKEREHNWRKSLNDLNLIEHKINDKNNFVLWFHSASMGEFEQAKPVIENIKQTYENAVIICSFFSPSGYNNQKNYQFADAVVYLPFDTRKNAINFIDKINPDFAIFVRYEIWRNYLEILRNKNIPRILINATYPRSKLLNLFKVFLRSTLDLFDEIYSINDRQTKLFNRLELKAKVRTLADTRFDRIISKIETAKINPVPSFELFEKDEIVLVAGSTWQPDENIIYSAFYKLKEEGSIIRLILVPHEPSPSNIERLERLFRDTILLSRLESIWQNNLDTDLRTIARDKVILVDSIGKLLGLYRYATLAYIGGAFGEGVHSVTEPAGYGIPLCAGKFIQSSPDAIELASIGCLQTVQNKDELYNWIRYIVDNTSERIKIGKQAQDYIYSRKGTSNIISNQIVKNVLKNANK